MFTADDRVIDRARLEALHRRLAGGPAFGAAGLEQQSGGPKRFAVCHEDPALTIATVLYLRQRGDAVVMMHGGTPLKTALRLAAEAGCAGIWYRELDRYYPLPSGKTPDGDGHAGLYQYSSGTTGLPKLIGRSWDAVQREIDVYNGRLASHGLDRRQPVVLASTSHAYGLITGVLAAMARGVPPTILTNPNPKAALKRIGSAAQPLVYAVPLQLQAIAPFLEAAASVLPRLSIVTSGAPLPAPMYERYAAQAAVMLQQYGCTEAGCISLAVGMKSHDDLGMPLDCIEADAGGEPAELTIRVGGGPRIATGDYVSRTVDGRLRFIGRADDLINVSGLKVMPLEVERVIDRLPGIVESVVYKQPHPIIGDQVYAMAAANREVTSEQVRAWCARVLPSYKVPSVVRMVEAIPRTAAGKINRRALAAAWAEEGGEG